MVHAVQNPSFFHCLQFSISVLPSRFIWFATTFLKNRNHIKTFNVTKQNPGQYTSLDPFVRVARIVAQICVSSLTSYPGLEPNILLCLTGVSMVKIPFIPVVYLTKNFKLTGSIPLRSIDQSNVDLEILWRQAQTSQMSL